MAKKFKAGSLYGRTGVFYDAIGIGAEPQGSGLFISGGNLTVDEGDVFFSSVPKVNGISLIISGDSIFSGFATTQNLDFISGSLQYQINNLNISANGASIVSDYDSGVSYIGRALVGSSESDSVWTITKIELTNSGTVVRPILKSINSPWTGRYFLNYQ